MTFVTDLPPASEGAITEIESAVGPLPADYRAFLKRSNGGVPDLCIFDVPDGNESVVQRFLSTGTGPDTLMSAIKFRADHLPEDFLPIGYDPGDNNIVLGLSGVNAGKLFFQYHDRDAPQPIAEARDLTFLAHSFDAFAAGLRLDE